MERPIPVQRREFLTSFVDPKVQPVIQPDVAGANRAMEISLKGDVDNIPKIGLEDIDQAIQFHFDNKLKLSVVQNNTRLTVPVIYGSPERWKSVQEDGFYRDINGKILVPLIMFKRETVEANRDLGFKLDGNNVTNVVPLQKGFSRKNIYDNFYLLTNQKPVQEWVLSIVPDYVTVTYSCVIFTDFVEQMNKLVEAINFASNSYWGDPTRFQFKARIENFQTPVSLEQDLDRAIKASFNLIVNGYLIPDALNAEIAKVSNKFQNYTSVVFNTEVAVSKR